MYLDVEGGAKEGDREKKKIIINKTATRTLLIVSHFNIFVHQTALPAWGGVGGASSV